MFNDGLPPLRDVLREFDLHAKKSYGQNFLLDLNLTQRIAQFVQPKDKTIIEIGPGPGGLTRALLAGGAAKVICIEADPRFAPALTQIAERHPHRLDYHITDALALHPNDLTDGPYHIASNLPYHIGTALLTKWLEDDWPPRWQSLTLMFQKEVAQRLVAPANSKPYGRLSILTQWRNSAEILLTLPPEAFVPPPKVSSAVIQIKPLTPRFAADQKMLAKVAAAAFNQRRKMLRSSLKQLCLDPEALLTALGIAPTRRGETLSIEEFCAISTALSEETK
jgi:16S rRNA (adenine1518-N6/adenine1519-N6)-dimethyltransferase